MHTIYILPVLLHLTLFPALIADDPTDWFEGFNEGESAPKLVLENYGRKSYYIGSIFKGTYFQGEQFCRYHGMELLSIDSIEENDFLQKKINDMGLLSERFYTSGTRLPDGKNWIWMSNGKRIVFTNWAPNEPNNSKDYDEQCVEIRGSTLLWNDVNCMRQLNFICEMSWPSDCYKLLEEVNATKNAKSNNVTSERLFDVRIKP